MLLITDLDGTLLTSQKTISPRTRQALIAFRQDGGLLAACSARPVSSMVRLLRQQQVDRLFSWCAGFNCGHLLEMAGQRIIHAAPLTATDLWNIDQHISLSRYHHHFFSAEAIHHRDDRLIAHWTTYEARLFGLPLITETAENIFNRRNIYKITLVAASPEIDNLCTEVNNHLPCGYYAVVTGENYIDIQRSDINKGCIIEQLIHYLNISSDKVVAIGDQQNDVSMFAAAGISIAMGNAPDAVKRQAGYVTATNDEEGIVHALEWLRCLTHPVTMRQRLTAAKDNESIKRRKHILDELNKFGEVTVIKLSEMLNVTSETIRRDLSLLESEGKITKIHGGAVKKQVVQEDAFSARIEAHREEKIAIGKLAAEMVSERDTLFIDSCTTNLILAEQLPPLAFSVITNSALIADKIKEHNLQARVYVLGGEYDYHFRANLGVSVCQQINAIHADICFIGAGGISPQHGVLVKSFEEAYVAKAMIAMSKKSVILADHTKFGQDGVMCIASVKEIDNIITDKGFTSTGYTPQDFAGKLRIAD